MKIQDLKGYIDFPSGLRLLSSLPIDARFAGEDEEFLNSIIETDSAYPGLKVYIKSTNKFYSYIKDSEGDYGFRVDDISFTEEQLAVFNSGITSEKVNEFSNKYTKPEEGIPEEDLNSELKEKLESYSKDIDDIKSSLDDILSEEEVISLIVKNSGRAISFDTEGNGFPSLEELSSGPWYYNGKPISKLDLTEGDQAYILASESQPSRTMEYTGDTWVVISEGSYQFTQSEKEVLSSGITSNKVSKIDKNSEDISTETERAIRSEINLSNKIGSDINSHNTSDKSHLDLRELISEVDLVANEGLSKAKSAQTTADTANRVINSLRLTMSSELLKKQDSLEGGGNSNSNLLLQPETSGGKPRTISKNSLAVEFENSKVKPVEERLMNRIITIEETNREQASDIRDLSEAVETAQQSAEEAQTTANSKVGSISESSTNGFISVDGSDVKIHGLKALAFRDNLSKEDLDLDKVINAEQATKEEFNSLKAKVESLEKGGGFVGSYENYNSLPGKVSDIESKYGIEPTVSDFATVRGGPYPDGTGLSEIDVTCWSIFRIDEDGNIYWAYEFTYTVDSSNKIDRVIGAEGKIPIFNSGGNLESSDKSMDDIDRGVSEARSRADTAFSKAVDAEGLASEANSLAESKYTKPEEGIPEEDLQEDVKTSLGFAKNSIKSIASYSGYVGGFTYTKADGTLVNDKVGGLGDLAGVNLENLEDAEGTLRYIGKNWLIEEVTLGYVSMTENPSWVRPEYVEFSYSPDLENGTYKIVIYPNDSLSESNNKYKPFKKVGELYFPKVRVFRVTSSTSVVEVVNSVSFNPTDGEITIESNYTADLIILIE